MDKRSKYSFNQKLSAVLAVKKGQVSIRGAALRLGCSRFSILQWISHYDQRGKAGLKFRVEKYTGEFRLMVVEQMLNKGLSLTQACSAFGIPNVHTIHRWLAIYNQKGSHALISMQRGQKSSPMARKKKQIEAEQAPEVRELARLQAEVAWLRAENDFLKKLDALTRKEEAQKKLKKERKPSGN